MAETLAQETGRFNLKIDAELLAEIQTEANGKGLSTTAYMGEILKNRKAVEEGANLSSDEHFIKGMRLCPECAERYRAYAHARPIMVKFFRDQIWNLWGTWQHGKDEDGCPGWQNKADAEEIRRYRDKLAEEFLNAAV